MWTYNGEKIADDTEGVIEWLDNNRMLFTAVTNYCKDNWDMDKVLEQVLGLDEGLSYDEAIRQITKELRDNERECGYFDPGLGFKIIEWKE